MSADEGEGSGAVGAKHPHSQCRAAETVGPPQRSAASKPVEWIAASSAPAKWVGPSARRVVVCHLLVRAVFVSGFVALGLATLDHERYRAIAEMLARFMPVDSVYAAGFALLPIWVFAALAYALCAPIARWFAFLGQLPSEERVIVEPFAVALVAEPRRVVSRFVVALAVASFVVPFVPLAFLLLIFLGWALPLALALWLLIDGLKVVSSVRVAKVTPAEPLLFGPVDRADLIDVLGRLRKQTLSEGGLNYWDPFGGYPRAIVALSMTPSGERVLKDAGLLHGVLA